MTTFFTNELLVEFLVWGFGVTGAALIGILVWQALGVMRKLDEQNSKAEEQFAAFGRQLSAVKDLLMDDIHRHDVRITRLEEWRKTRDGKGEAD